MIRTYSEDKALVRKKRAQILKCAKPLFLEKGYHKTSMRELAEACNMSPGTIYRYIGRKEDLLSLIAGNTDLRVIALRKYYHRLGNVSSTDILRLCIKKYMKDCNEDQDLILFVNREIKNFPKPDRHEFLEALVHFMDIFKEIINEGIKTGEFIVDDPEMIAYNIVLLGHDWALWRWYLRKRYSLRGFVKIQTEAILSAIKQDGSFLSKGN